MRLWVIVGEKDIIFKGQYSEGVFPGGEETLAEPPKIPRFGWREEGMEGGSMAVGIQMTRFKCSSWEASQRSMGI